MWNIQLKTYIQVEACRKGLTSREIEVLIEAGADVDARDAEGAGTAPVSRSSPFPGT